MKIFRNIWRSGKADKEKILVKQNDGEYHTRGVFWPRDHKEFIFQGVNPGDYEFVIEHSDDIAHRLRKSIVLQISVDGEKLNLETASDFKCKYNKKYGAYLNLDFGSVNSGRILHCVKVSIPYPVQELGLSIDFNVNRVVNIDHLILRPVGKDTERPIGLLYRHSTKDHRDRIKKLEKQIALLEDTVRRHTETTDRITRRNAPNVQQISDIIVEAAAKKKKIFFIYSGIDLNVVDGSSVWVSNMANVVSEDSFVVILTPKIVKSDIITSQLKNPDNCLILSVDSVVPHENFYENFGNNTLSIDDWIGFLQRIDAVTPAPLYFLLRGTSIAEAMLSDRFFYRRCLLYLTDFYVVEDDTARLREDIDQSLPTMGRQASGMLYQTDAIRALLSDGGVPDDVFAPCPPVLPSLEKSDQPKALQHRDKDERVHIVYAGKIAPNWGVEELLRFAVDRKIKGNPIRLTLISNKISSNSKSISTQSFREEIRRLIDLAEAELIQYVSRDQVPSYLTDADYVWCFRPGRFEENTLELSTKLLEAAALGCRAICYPNEINKSVLGDDYPYFVRNIDDFADLLGDSGNRSTADSDALAARIYGEYSLEAARQRWRDSHFAQKCAHLDTSLPTICFAGDDFKFLDPYVSRLTNRGFPILRDKWNWGSKDGIEESFELARQSDIIFCEWGLANAVWHSRNNNVKKPLFIRVHLQEINERASKFGYQINIDNVTKIIFVSERVKNVAKEMFGWPEGKLTVIPNFVLDNEYVCQPLSPHLNGKKVTLGMVGIVPWRKRFDRAVETLVAMRALGVDANLKIKGPRPEQLHYMQAPGRVEELKHYEAVYKMIDDLAVGDYVEFAPWGNDMVSWYRDIDVILSPSDFESFHYAVADGVLSGCYPVLWPWSEAAEIYTPDWTVADVNGAAERIAGFLALDPEERQKVIEENRSLVVGRYGEDLIFDQLDRCLGIEHG